MKSLRILALSLLAACNNSQPVSQAFSLEDEGEFMSATVMGARGLYTSPNILSGAPMGSAAIAENMVVERPGVYETRRGYEGIGANFPEGAAQSLVEFKGTLIGWGGTTLARFDEISGVWIPYAGDNAAPTLGAVTVVSNPTGNAPPTVALTGAYIPPGLEFITLVVSNGGTEFAWSSGNGDNNPSQVIPVDDSPVTLFAYGPPTIPGPIGIEVQWAPGETYADGDSWSFTVSGGTAGVYSAPLGPLKASDGTLLTGKVMFHETGGCLYFTTSRGVYRLETPTSTPELSGAPQGLPSTAALTGTSGFLPSGQSVAYRETWSKRTPEGRIIEGAPSGRVTVFNTLTATGTITFSGSSGTTSQTINGVGGFSQTTGTDAVRGAALASAINASANPAITGVLTAAHNGAGVVTISAVNPSAAGNAITLAVTGTGVTSSGATLTGGGATRNVSRTIYIPPDVTPDMFVRVWRTESFPNALGPGEDYAQVHEKALADMPAGATTYTFADITPDAIRGDAAYFSASLGDGLVSSKYRPPLATDVVTFRDATVYVGATGRQAAALTLTSAAATYEYGIRIIYADGVSELFRSTLGSESGFQFKSYTDGTPSQNIERTTQSLVRTISRSSSRALAMYLSDDNGTPGSFSIEARALDEPQFTLRAWNSSVPFFPALRVAAETSTATGRTATEVTVQSEPPHGLSVGSLVVLSYSGNETLYPLGTKTVSVVIDDFNFKYSDPGGVVSASASSIEYESRTQDLFSEQQGGPAFVAWTPLGEPDAVPVLQYVRVGKDENPVLGATLLGNSLYLRKADGLYRLSGDVPATFALDQVDTTVSFIAPWAAFTLGGNAYALTTEGLKTWTETGKPQPASVPVEAEIRDLIVKNKDAVDRYAFAVNYESDRTMFLWMPTTDNQERADFSYRFNYLTDSWTTETTDALSAVVSPTKDRLFVGMPVDEGSGFAPVLLERKDRLPSDYADMDGEPIVSRLVYSPQLGSDPSLGKHFNRMKYHLDPDAAVPTSVTVTFTSDWTPETGSVTIPGILARGRTLETLVTANNRRGTRLFVGIEHDTPGEKLSILGYTVSFYEHPIGTL